MNNQAFTNCDQTSMPPSGIQGTKMPYKIFKRKPRNTNLMDKQKVHMIKTGPYIQSNLLLSKAQSIVNDELDIQSPQSYHHLSKAVLKVDSEIDIKPDFSIVTISKNGVYSPKNSTGERNDILTLPEVQQIKTSRAFPDVQSYEAMKESPNQQKRHILSQCSSDEQSKSPSLKNFQSLKSSPKNDHGSQAHLAYLKQHVDYDEVNKKFMNPHILTNANKAGGNGGKKSSQDIAVFIRQFNRQLKPLSQIKKYQQTPDLNDNAFIKNKIQAYEAEKHNFKKGILTKIKEYEERDHK